MNSDEGNQTLSQHQNLISLGLHNEEDIVGGVAILCIPGVESMSFCPVICDPLPKSSQKRMFVLRRSDPGGAKLDATPYNLLFHTWPVINMYISITYMYLLLLSLLKVF